MKTVYIDDSAVSLTPNNYLTEGGVAEIYKIPPGTSLVKLYKTRDHPSYVGNTPEKLAMQSAAVARLREMDSKLQQFPTTLPARIMGPEKLVYDAKGARRRVIGYQMPFVQGAITLREFSHRDTREQGGITQDDVVKFLANLHDTYTKTHDAGVVIADCNPLNALVQVKTFEDFIIDADSMQFGSFMATEFTPGYVDPLICSKQGLFQTLVKPHSADTDWYSFAMLYWECLLYVHPFGGVYKPANPKDRCGIDDRPFKKIWVGNPEVRYPVAGIPYKSLPDTVIDWYRELIEKGVRQPFPRNFVEGLRFNQATAYLAVSTSPTVVTQIDTAAASCKRIFDVAPPGVIVQAVVQGGRLYYLYHKNGEYFRENGGVVMKDALNGNLKFRIHKDYTLVGKTGNAKLYVMPDRKQVSADTLRGGSPVYETNGNDYFYVSSGKLFRGSPQTSPVEIDDVCADQTNIFVGPTFGFGYYLAGDYRRSFVFDGQRTGKSDVDIACISGRLIDLACYFSENKLWLIATVQQGGRMINRCTLIGRDGQILASHEEPEGSDSWLGALTGKCACWFAQPGGGAPQEFLAAATDDGIVLLQQNGNQIAAVKTFAGTSGMVGSTDNLLFAKEGLYAWNGREIRLITTK